MLLELAGAQVDAAAPDRARVALERALELCKPPSEVPPGVVAEVHLALAKVRWGAGERDPARALASAAIERLERGPSPPDPVAASILKDLHGWLDRAR
jgi:hypothetical protein